MKRIVVNVLLVAGLVGCKSKPYGAPDSSTSRVVSPQPAPTPPPPDPASRWEIRKTTDALDGTVHLTVLTHEVVVRCVPKVEAYIRPTLSNLGGRLEMEDGHEQAVRFRLDSGPVTKQIWGIADSLDALFIPRSVIKRMGKSKSLVVQYSPEYQTPETETFDLEGLGEAEAKAGCKI